MRCGLRLGLAGVFLFTALVETHRAQNSKVQIEMVNSYPELRVDGKPFLIHSAAFFYDRLPQEEWETSLRRHLALGINTIDLYIPWNWHEPQEGKLDFDGTTNPRRNLEGLLKLISGLGLKLIVRPGPVILNEWKNGGYPDWLLLRPEYQESMQDVLEGRYPRLSNLSPAQSEDASRQWLANDTHLQYTRQWYFDVMRVLSPYLASHGGNILFFQLDDDQAINRSNYSGPNFWRYMQVLRQDLEDAAEAAGGRADDIFAFINPTDMRVTAAGFDPSLHPPIAAMGQWYMSSGNEHLTFDDVNSLSFYVEELKTQPRFPPMIIEFQAGWYVPGDDTRPKYSQPENTILASRTLLAHGLRGLNYFPAQDTLYPAGYEVPWTNHFYTWDAGLDVNSNLTPRSAYIYRNGRLIHGMGELIAQTHQHSSAGIVYTLGDWRPQDQLTRSDVAEMSARALALQQYALQNKISTEFVDPQYETLQQLQRHSVLLMPIINPPAERGLGLDAAAEKNLAEFVENGGTLITYPQMPTQGLLAKWFEGISAEKLNVEPGDPVSLDLNKSEQVIPEGAIETYELSNGPDPQGSIHPLVFHNTPQGTEVWAGFEKPQGKGHLIQLGFDFTAVAPQRTQGVTNVTFVQPSTDSTGVGNSAPNSNSVLRTLLNLAGSPPVLNWSIADAGMESRDMDVQLQEADACNGFGFVSAVNFSEDQIRTLHLSLEKGDRCLLPVEFPPLTLMPHDALWLPVHLPLNKFVSGVGDAEVVASNSELVKVAGRENAIELTLSGHAMSQAEVILRLADPSAWQFNSGTEKLQPVIQGNLVRLSFPLTEGLLGKTVLVLEKVSPAANNKGAGAGVQKDAGRGSAAFPFNEGNSGVQINLRTSFSLPVEDPIGLRAIPPILVLETSAPTRLIMEVKNGTAEPARYSVSMKVNGYSLNTAIKKIEVDPHSVKDFDFSMYLFLKGWINPKTKVAPGELRLKGMGQVIVKNFTMVTLDPGTAVAYATDLDQDGFPEVIIENSELRLIVTPNAGARAFVLYDKRLKRNFFTSVGALRDRFAWNENPAIRTQPRQIRGYFGLHNRPYSYEILASGGETAVARFTYEAPDVAPQGVLIQKTITLKGSAGFFDVAYEITPHGFSDAIPQAFISVNSVKKTALEGPESLEFRLQEPSETSLDRVERVSHTYSGEVRLHFRPFQKDVAEYSYRFRCSLPLEISQNLR
ncbi:MAG: beta-galactosidase [Acidobacteriia bacterium]|nr:beta-galactosidase [Terriglobia bacterium]